MLATEARWPFAAALSAGIAMAGLVALAVGVPMFRLTEHSFAMGTLGFALVAQIVATNWVDFTRGPLCVTGIPKPQLGSLRIATLPGFYWTGLAAVGLVGLLYHGLTTFRLGRAFHAVRDNETLASAASIDPLGLLLLYLPQHVLLNLVSLVYFASRGQGRAIARAKWDALRGLPRVLRERTRVQRTRTVGAWALRRLFRRGWFAPYGERLRDGAR